MKNIVLTFIILFSVNTINAQIFSGTQEIDRATKEGFYTTVSMEDSYVKQLWQKELYKYGYVEVIKNNIFQVNNARIPSITNNVLNLISKVNTERGRTKIFLSLAQNDETFINTSHPKYYAAEKILNDFVDLLKQHQTIKIEEKGIEEFKDKQQKTTINSDKLTRAIESNQKEKEKLLKKMEENKAELDKLMVEVEQNKKEQMIINENLMNQKKKIDDVKNKIIKP